MPEKALWREHDQWQRVDEQQGGLTSQLATRMLMSAAIWRKRSGRALA